MSSTSQPRSAGKSPTASPPAATRCHRSSGERTPPGYRHAIPTIAMGSSSSAGAAAASGAAAMVRPVSSVRSCRASAWALGWSKTSVGGSARPVSALSLLRSSTAVRESKPKSLKARSASTSPALLWPRTAAACVRTRSTSSACCSVSGILARRSARGEAAAVPGPPAVLSAVRIRSASGRSPSRALGRPTVNGGRNRSQSTSATVAVASPESSARRSPATASAAGIGIRPRRRSRSSAPSASAMPPPAHGPQATAVAGRPWARRRSASPSSRALAAA
ncbi:hypothetical protein Save01_06443 [Streptomyces avermitilis]